MKPTIVHRDHPPFHGRPLLKLALNPIIVVADSGTVALVTPRLGTTGRLHSDRQDLCRSAGYRYEANEESCRQPLGY